MSKEKSKETGIKELGEFGLIRHLTKDLKVVNESTQLGVGDDAAILDHGNKQIVVTTDMLTEGIHFDLIYTPLKHLGYKAVVVNLSDIYAMNATPKQITVSIAISSKFTLEMTEELYSGIKLACEKYKVDLVGGDTTASLTGMTISITAIGVAEKDELVYRNGAKNTNLICVSGDLGGAYMGLLLMEREKKVFETNPNMQPDFKGHDYILERHLKPEAKNNVISFLKEKGIKPTAMIDISDGLSSEILHICQQSEVGCKLIEEKIPIDLTTSNMAEEFHMVPTVAAMNGGEDYELLFTIDVKEYDKIKDDDQISVIGHITPKNDGCYLITNADTAVELKAQGWNPIKG
jgi:thiamine-monophosphate kinase